jgi:hypothetical protein
MKVGILVVYLISNDNDWVLEKHIDHLAQTQPFMDFKVYAAVNRLPARYHHLLRAHDFIEIVSLPTLHERETAEHGTYLNALANYALHDGCDYICTLDVDSWPIRCDWIKISHDLLIENKAAAVAVLRAENGDTVLPHPSFTFVEAGLFRNHDCCYWLDEKDRSADFRQFLLSHSQYADTGAPLGYFLESHGLQWVKLHRSNKINFHFLMGGIYGGFVFHMGASSRKVIVFRGDDASRLAKISQPIGSVPVLWRFERPFLKFLKSTSSVRRKNQVAFDTIARKLRGDEQVFYAELLGDAGGIEPFDPRE